jgi:uncharacterized membrane protein YdbT with pleckstrin-like domain
MGAFPEETAKIVTRDNRKRLMMDLKQETTLAKVRLHWGIFIPVLLSAFGPIVASLPLIFLAHGLVNALSQIGMPANPGLNLIWLSVLVPYFVIVLGLLLGTWFSYLKSEVILTDRRLVFRTGLLSRRSGELPLENVESIYISEPLLGRMFGYGTVTVTTVGGAGFPLSFIGSPQNFHSTLQKAVFDAKNSLRRIPKPPESGSPPQDDDSRYKPKG